MHQPGKRKTNSIYITFSIVVIRHPQTNCLRNKMYKMYSKRAAQTSRLGLHGSCLNIYLGHEGWKTYLSISFALVQWWCPLWEMSQKQHYADTPWMPQSGLVWCVPMSTKLSLKHEIWSVLLIHHLFLKYLRKQKHIYNNAILIQPLTAQMLSILFFLLLET